MNKLSTGLRALLLRVRALFTSSRLDHEFDHELETHISLLTEENIRQGMTPEEARYAALRSFGGVTQVKETNRERRGLHQLEILLQIPCKHCEKSKFDTAVTSNHCHPIKGARAPSGARASRRTPNNSRSTLAA